MLFIKLRAMEIWKDINGITVCDLVHKRVLNSREEKYINSLTNLIHAIDR